MNSKLNVLKKIFYFATSKKEYQNYSKNSQQNRLNNRKKVHLNQDQKTKLIKELFLIINNSFFFKI